MKICTKCKTKKDISEFGKLKSSKDGHKGMCKKCHILETLEWQGKNTDKVKKSNKKYRDKNPEKVKEANKKRTKEKIKKANNIWRKNNLEAGRQSVRNWKQKNKDYNKIRMNKDLNYKFICNLRSTINTRIKQGKSSKAYNTFELLGCSIAEARQYLESLWTVGMSWETYGKFGWHIDHIRPCASFDLTDPEQQKECFNYKNLQPLWWTDNLIKGDKY